MAARPFRCSPAPPSSFPTLLLQTVAAAFKPWVVDGELASFLKGPFWGVNCKLQDMWGGWGHLQSVLLADGLWNLPCNHFDHVCLFVIQMWTSISESTECFKTEMLHKFRVIIPTLLYSQLLPNIPTDTREQRGALTPSFLTVPSCSSSVTCLSSPHILCWLFLRKKSLL